MLTCKNCYAGLRFDPEKQKLVCDFCGSEFTAEEYKGAATIDAEQQDLTPEEAEFFAGHTIKEESKKQDTDTYQAYLMTCPQCGGELLTTEETAATFCSYCGSSVLLQSRITKEKRPEYIIPFQKTREDCERLYRDTVKKALFVPSRMLKDEQIERFRGIYMPYWVYDFSYHGDHHASGSKTHRKGDYLITNEYDISSYVEADYNGLAFDASSSFSDNLSEAIAPFDFHEAKPFDPSYLSGFYADTNDVSANLYEQDAMEIGKMHMVDQLMQNPTYRQYGSDSCNVGKNVIFKSGKPKLAMYPVWFLATRNKTGDRISYAVVNGQTGEVAADLPIDYKKLILGTIIWTVPLFLLFSLVLTLKPNATLFITIIFSIIGMIVAYRQTKLAYETEHNLNDRGYMSVHDPWTMKQRAQQKSEAARVPEKKEETPKAKKKKTPADRVQFLGSLFVLLSGMIFLGAIEVESVIALAVAGVLFGLSILLICIGKVMQNKIRKKTPNYVPKETGSFLTGSDKFKVVWKPLLAMILAFVIMIARPVSDLYYYTVDVIAVVLITWSFMEVFRAHNRMSVRPLPQFGKRGGDENGEH